VFLATVSANLDTPLAKALAVVKKIKPTSGDKPAAVEGPAAVLFELLSSAAALSIVLVPTGLGNASLDPSSGGGLGAPIFFYFLSHPRLHHPLPNWLRHLFL
jgi:hypothetical protein